jgi:hypothetical protein
LHGITVFEVNWYIFENIPDLTNAFKDAHDITLNEILNGGVSLIGNNITIFEAHGDLLKILLFEKTTDESVHELNDLGWSHLIEAPFGLWDWAEGEDHDVGNTLTGGLVLFAGEFVWDLLDIGNDGTVVLEDIGTDDLQKLGGILKDLTPVLDSGDVTLHGAAVLEVVWNLLDDISDLTNAGNDVLDITLLEILNGSGNLLGDSITMLEALSDFLKVLLVGKTQDESIHEVNDLGWRHHKLELVWGPLGKADTHDF